VRKSSRAQSLVICFDSRGPSGVGVIHFSHEMNIDLKSDSGIECAVLEIGDGEPHKAKLKSEECSKDDFYIACKVTIA